MPREQVVVKNGVRARVVKFEEPDDLVEEKVDVQRTAEEIEWARFQWRWAKWKRRYDFRPPDPANLQSGISG